MSYPPFEMLDSSGQPAGVSVDMARAMGQYLNRPVRFENIPFDGLIPSLKTGKIDVIISSLTMTEDRKKSIDFSDPYLTMGLAILVNKNSDIRSINDVDKPSRNVAVKRGRQAISMQSSTSKMRSCWSSTKRARVLSKWRKARQTVLFMIRFQSSKLGKNTRTQLGRSFNRFSRNNGRWGFRKETTTFDSK